MCATLVTAGTEGAPVLGGVCGGDEGGTDGPVLASGVPPDPHPAYSPSRGAQYLARSGHIYKASAEET